MTPVWEVSGLTKRFASRRWFGGASDGHHVALSGVSLSVSPGERVGIIGESGSGKTTLARVGMGLLPPDSGTVRLLGENTASWSARRWREARHSAQLLFQDPRAMLNPEMTLGHLLAESSRIHDPDRDATVAVREILARVGLEGRNGAYPRELSGGERRRAGIARLLLARPRLVVADEPTAGLDAALKADLLELLLDRVGEQCAVVLISHDVPLVLWCCSRVLVMNDGQIVDRFTPDEIGHVEHHPHTRELLQAAGLQVGVPPAQESAS